MHKGGMLIHEATVVVVIGVIIDRVSAYTKQLWVQPVTPIVACQFTRGDRQRDRLLRRLLQFN